MAKDFLRDQWFLDHGWIVLRFSDNEVIDETDTVVAIIQDALRDPATAMPHLQGAYARRWSGGAPSSASAHDPDGLGEVE